MSYKVGDYIGIIASRNLFPMRGREIKSPFDRIWQIKIIKENCSMYATVPVFISIPNYLEYRLHLNGWWWHLDHIQDIKSFLKSLALEEDFLESLQRGAL